MSLKSLTKMSKNILIIAGHSGSGKSTVAKELHEKTGYELLGFSYAGRELANLTKFESRFAEINDYIYHCIINTVNNEGTVIVARKISKYSYMLQMSVSICKFSEMTFFSVLIFRVWPVTA